MHLHEAGASCITASCIGVFVVPVFILICFEIAMKAAELEEMLKEQVVSPPILFAHSDVTHFLYVFVLLPSVTPCLHSAGVQFRRCANSIIISKAELECRLTFLRARIKAARRRIERDALEAERLIKLTGVSPISYWYSRCRHESATWCCILPLSV